NIDSLYRLVSPPQEFWEARNWVRDSLQFANVRSVSVFETTIRELGGLLAAYDLSGDRIFLEKAAELGDRLLPAFNTPTGIPLPQVDLSNGRANANSWASGSVLAELGTLQVEFRYLSNATGDRRYAEAVNHVFELLASMNPKHGLFPIYISPSTGKFTSDQV
ncbi:unnamed protein product, partial [Phaeothamnion confervicola]